MLIDGKEQLDEIKSYVEIGREEAQLVYGGAGPDDPTLQKGYFIQPTIFTEVENHMRLAQEEIFGPVLAVIPFDNEEQVVKLANDTRYGLASGIWTKDIRRAHRMAAAIRSGESLKEYTQVKTVFVELTGQTRDPFRMG